MILTKSTFMRGLRCPKRLWMDAFMPMAADNTINEEEQNATFKKVAEFAMGYFGEYKEIPYSVNKKKMLSKTKDMLIAGEKTICRATFENKGNVCSVDILRNYGEYADIIEVKSSLRVSDVYLYDMAYQYYVASMSGIKIRNVYNMHLNKDYVRNGALDIQELFELTDCTEEVIKRQPFIRGKLREIRRVAREKDEPAIDISENCSTPYDCPYWKYCSRNLERPNLFDVHGMQKNKQFELYNDGIITFEQLYENKSDLTEKQLRQIDFELNNRAPYINKKQIQNFLKTITYPLYFLDFEAYSLPIPDFDGTSPYQQLPFQYSLHVLRTEDSPLEHYEFLAKEGTDPRRELAEKLVKDIPAGVCTLAYNNTFEKSVISRLAAQFPDLSEHLMGIHSGIKDLMTPFLNQDYYCNAMKGSCSLKHVLPAMCPDDAELDYSLLEGVHNGAEASAVYAEMQNHTKEEIENIRENLLKYCGLDTYAMVKILEKLKKAVADE